MDLVVRQGERNERVRVERHPAGYRVTVGERSYDIDSVATDGGLYSLLIDGAQHEVMVCRQRDGGYTVSNRGFPSSAEVLDPLAHLARETHAAAGAGGPLRVTAYMPGRVAAVLVEEGAEVAEGAGVVVLEAMKMENEIRAERPGVIQRVFVRAGQNVEGGDPLFEIG